jgi:hypothetical protein
MSTGCALHQLCSAVQPPRPTDRELLSQVLATLGLLDAQPGFQRKKLKNFWGVVSS